MHIAILAPSDRSFTSKHLPDTDFAELPEGSSTAPFIGIIIDELLKRGHTVTAITTSKAIRNNYSTQEFKHKKFTWIVVPFRPHSFRMNGTHKGRILDLYGLEQNMMLKHLKTTKPDIVHAHWSYEFAGAAVKSGFPCLVTIHDDAVKVLYFFKNLYRLGRLIMSEAILKKTRFASTVSPYMIPYALKRVKNTRLIANPVVISEEFETIETLIQVKVNQLLNAKIVMINNGWDNRKNGIKGLMAFKELQNKYPNITLHLFGNGSENNGAAYTDVEKLEVQNVHFYGAVDHSFLMKTLMDTHLLLHTSLEESFGVVLIEAMSFGIPVIGGNSSGAVPWVVNNENLLVDVRNSHEIALKMEDLLVNSERYKDYAKSGYTNAASRFSVNSVVNDYQAYYEEIVAQW